MPRQFDGKIKVFSINGVGMTYKLIEKNVSFDPYLTLHTKII